MSISLDHLLIFGLGYSAGAIAERLKGRFKMVSATTRSPEKADAIAAGGLHPILFDGESCTEELADAIGRATHIVHSIAPKDGVDPVLAHCRRPLENADNLRWLGYLSTVGVYGDHGGAWVDEMTPPKPVSKRSVARLTAERAWLDFGKARSVAIAVLRLSGIYGPGRNALIKVADGTSRRLVKPGQVFNRIHRDDIATAAGLALTAAARGVFNITDDEPAPPQDVVAFAHELAGVSPPPELDFEKVELTPMARSFYGENKRVSNAKSKAELAMAYTWPDYRTALAAMWADGSWR